MGAENRITKVAIVGAGGRCGRYVTEALLENGKHTVTAITRTDSTSGFPDGVTVTKVDFADPLTLTASLKGQDALVMTLSLSSPLETEAQLIRAAADAGVPWVLPNDWSPDTDDEALVKDISVLQPRAEARKLISRLGKSSYISVSTSFWYEWSLSIPEAFGIDIKNRSVTYFDRGETRISTSTWPQVGRTVAALLSLPVESGMFSSEVSLGKFRNKVVHVNSFTLSQKDMFESVLRVTGTDTKEWTVKHEHSKDRYDEGLKADSVVKLLYSRVFYPDGSGDVENSKGTINGLLGLPTEDVDDATRRAMERLDSPVVSPPV
ncbi:putative protein YbjT [Geosmithia morbida]|uniref:NmrA-like domain-containing protein n=1 Tax=Geosmithia morbida TaxID=1094350 RepID=A0A9P5CXU0_9HYPO|nr:putative protein YbjT [Geosmithia morbida]KAF4119658.1 putative protein YbjT [Geosmithia morbida]